MEIHERIIAGACHHWPPSEEITSCFSQYRQVILDHTVSTPLPKAGESKYHSFVVIFKCESNV